MTGWQWHQLDHMQIICSLLQTDNHACTLSLSFYRPDALPAAQPTASKHWRQTASQIICLYIYNPYNFTFSNFIFLQSVMLQLIVICTVEASSVSSLCTWAMKLIVCLLTTNAGENTGKRPRCPSDTCVVGDSAAASAHGRHVHQDGLFHQEHGSLRCLSLLMFCTRIHTMLLVLQCL